jgi:hypothetical protein
LHTCRLLCLLSAHLSILPHTRRSFDRRERPFRVEVLSHLDHLHKYLYLDFVDLLVCIYLFLQFFLTWTGFRKVCH